MQTALPTHQPLYEPFVLGEGPWGCAVLGSDTDADTFERLLHVISNGSFPRGIDAPPYPLAPSK